MRKARRGNWIIVFIFIISSIVNNFTIANLGELGQTFVGINGVVFIGLWL